MDIEKLRKKVEQEVGKKIARLKATPHVPAKRKSKLERQYKQFSRPFLCNRGYKDKDPLDAYRRCVKRLVRGRSVLFGLHCEHLLEAASNPMMLKVALDQIKAKHGKHYFQGTACGDIEPHIWDFLREIRKQVAGGTYSGGKCKRIKVPKYGGGFRVIEIPPPETQVVSKNLQNILEPLLDPSFSRFSIGSRKNKNVQLGVAIATRLYNQGYQYWVACDLQDAFGSIPRPRLNDVLEKRLCKSPVIPLVNEVLGKRKKGIPQGVAISPLMLNLYLDHFLDKWWARKFPKLFLIRYLDDILIPCGTMAEAQECYEALQKRVTSIGMVVKERQKEAVFDVKEKAVSNWLGFSFKGSASKGLTYSISEKSWDRLETKLLDISVMTFRGVRFTVNQLRAIGTGRIREKALAIPECEVSGYAEAVRERGRSYNVDLSDFTDRVAGRSWEKGCKLWEDACDVAENLDLSAY